MLNKFWTKYKTLSDATKSSVWFMISGIIQKGLAFITVPIFVRLMTEAEYGKYTTFMSWENVLAIFVTLNLSYQSFNNGMVKYSEDKDGYTSAMLGLALALGLLSAAVYFPFRGVIDRYLEFDGRYMLCMLVNMVSISICGILIVRERYRFNYRGILAYTIGVAVINPLLGLAMIWNAGDGALARVLSVTIVNLGACIVMSAIILRRSPRLIRGEYWKYACKLNVALIPHYLSMVLLGNSDRIMISQFCGEASVAKYGLANNLATVMYFVTSAINASLVPWIYHKLKEKQYRSVNDLSVKIVALVGVASIIPALFANELVRIMAPPQYAEAIKLIPVMSSCVLLKFGYNLFSNIELFFEKTKYIAFGTAGATVINILTNAIFIPMYGYGAAAVTTLVCYGLLFVFHYLAMRRVCIQKNMGGTIYDIKSIGGICIITVAAALLLGCLQQFFVVRFAIVVAMCVVMWVFRKNILNILKNIKKE